MGIFAALAGAQAVAMFLMGGAFALLTYFSSQRLHRVRLTLSSFEYAGLY